MAALIGAEGGLMWLLWRGRVDNAVRYQGRAVAEWLSAQDDRDPTTRAQAAYALTQVTLTGPAERRAALAAEARLVDDPVEDVRTEAANALIDLAKDKKDSAQVVWIATGLLRDSARPTTRAGALHVLGAFGPLAISSIPAITNQLRASSPIVRTAAVASLGAIGARDSGTVSALAGMVRDDDSNVREAALDALTRIGAATTTVLPVALAALNDTAAGVREQAAYSLGTLRPVPDAAINHLAELLWDPVTGVRLAAAEALAHGLPAPRPRDALGRAARDSDPTVNVPARAALVGR